MCTVASPHVILQMTSISLCHMVWCTNVQDFAVSILFSSSLSLLLPSLPTGTVKLRSVHKYGWTTFGALRLTSYCHCAHIMDLEITIVPTRRMWLCPVLILIALVGNNGTTLLLWHSCHSICMKKLHMLGCFPVYGDNNIITLHFWEYLGISFQRQLKPTHYHCSNLRWGIIILYNIPSKDSAQKIAIVMLKPFPIICRKNIYSAVYTTLPIHGIFSAVTYIQY